MSDTTKTNKLANVDNQQIMNTVKRIKGTAEELLKLPVSESTLRVYRIQWSAFSAFCAKYRVAPLPASHETVVDYISDMIKNGKRPATISQALAAITSMHNKTKNYDPTKHSTVRLAMKNARSPSGMEPHKKNAVTDTVLTEILDRLDRSTLQGKRDAAILLLGFFGAFRRSELVALDKSDISDITTKDGHTAYKINVRRSDTGNDRYGMTKVIFPTQSKKLNPYAALHQWLTAAQISDGAIFRRVRKGDRITDERLTGQAVAIIVKRAAAASGLALDVAGHSLRSGFITSALLNGATERSIMNQTGHKSVTVMRSYEQQINTLADNAAESLAARL